MSVQCSTIDLARVNKKEYRKVKPKDDLTFLCTV